MDHEDHVTLLRPGIEAPGGTWADLGSGAGAFTLALRELTGPDSLIFAVDRDRRALEDLERLHRARFGSLTGLQTLPADLAGPLDLPPLDGVVMANSLHFFRDKLGLLERVRGLLKPGGRLLLVEYNVDRGNLWVPHPLSFETFRRLAPRAGFSEPALLARAPSTFLREFYSALAFPA